MFVILAVERASESVSVPAAKSLSLSPRSPWCPLPTSHMVPNGYSQIFRSYAIDPSGFWTMALLRYTAKFNPFLSLDCTPSPPHTPSWRNPRKGRDHILSSGNLDVASLNFDRTWQRRQSRPRARSSQVADFSPRPRRGRSFSTLFWVYHFGRAKKCSGHSWGQNSIPWSFGGGTECRNFEISFRLPRQFGASQVVH